MGDLSETDRVTPRSRRAVGAAMIGGEFWIYGGFGVGGTTRPDDIGSDLWRFGNGWEIVSERGPYPARYPSLCAAPGGFYMFGGCGHNGRYSTFLNGLWAYDGAWKPVDTAGGTLPEGRYTSALALKGRNLIMFGGHSQTPDGDKSFYGDLWLFDLELRVWAKAHGHGQGPGRRYGFGWAADADRLYIFGGYDGTRDLGDLWVLDLSSLFWEKVPQAGPEPRYCPALGMVGGVVVLFGGRSKVDPRHNLSDTWIYRDGWRRFIPPGGEPEPGYHAKPAYASDGKSMWMFAGEGPQGHVSDLWTFGPAGWRKVHGNRKDDPVLW